MAVVGADVLFDSCFTHEVGTGNFVSVVAYVDT